MVHFICCDCQTGFVAKSYDEWYEKEGCLLSDEEKVKAEIDARGLYAIYCPYCGGTNIEVR